jgi:hypothetical protein
MGTVEEQPVATVERHPVLDYPPREEPAIDTGAGWRVFAAVALALGGMLGLMSGIVAVADSTFYVAGAKFVFSDLNTWGWIVTAAGALALASGLGVTSRAQWARWGGIVIAVFQAIVQLLMIQAYPMWSMCIFAVDVLVVYALAAHGGRVARPQT